MKIRSVGAELFHADGRTDITKLRVAFRNFANTPKYGYTTVLQTRSVILCTFSAYRFKMCLAETQYTVINGDKWE